jgi:Domain of unknown function (DUF4337)
MPDIELPNPDDLEELKARTFTRRVALTTAIYALLLAIGSLGGGNATKDMMLAQQQATDQWAFFQAKSIREHQARIEHDRLELELAEHGAAMTPEVREKHEAQRTRYGKEVERYDKEKQEIEKRAREFERERDVNRAKDPYFDYGTSLLQIAIVLSSVAIISNSPRMFGFSLVVACVGLLLMLNGFTLLFGRPALPGN